MEKNNKTKRVFILLVTYFVIIFTSKSCNDSHRYKPQITYNQEYSQDSPLPYATYSNGNVYIAKEEIISDIITDENDIYIIDQRDGIDPNFRIDSSYRITSERQRNEIIKILLNYESEYPSNWNRDEESLRNEWEIHNICHTFGIKPYNTSHVDLDNNDREKYDSPVLTLILNNKKD